MGPGMTVGTGGGKGIINIRYRQNPTLKRNIFPLQAVRVACAIPFLMMVLYTGQHRPGEGDRVQNVRTDTGMFLNLRELFIGQASRLQQDIFRYTELTNVMEQGRRFQPYQLISGNTHTLRNGDSVLLDAKNMLVRVLVFGVNSQRQAANRCQVQVRQSLLAFQQGIRAFHIATIRNMGKVGDDRHTGKRNNNMFAEQMDSQTTDRRTQKIGGRCPEESLLPELPHFPERLALRQRDYGGNAARVNYEEG